MFSSIILVAAACYSWDLREKDDSYVYDGDTIYITMSELPEELSNMSVRLLGIDTPESGWRAQCPEEVELGRLATNRLEQLLRNSTDIYFCNISWDKYGGRIDAEVIIDGQNVTEILINEGLGRAYNGGQRSSWCE